VLVVDTENGTRNKELVIPLFKRKELSESHLDKHQQRKQLITGTKQLKYRALRSSS